MHLQEVILASTGATPSNPGPGSVSLHDFQTGSSLASFKQTSAGLHSTAVLPTRDGQGGFILAAQADKSLLHAYHFQKDQIAVKMVLPEKLSCLATDGRGDYCAGGTTQGRIYFWEIASGILFNVWDAHYNKISVLRFTSDGAALISGSDDSGVSVWQVSRIVADELQHESPTPYWNMSDHTLPVTDVTIGIGSFPNCRILTASIDHSVKLWDLSTRTLLTTFVFPNAIHSLAFEIAERTFFAASSDSSGCVYQVQLFRRRSSQGRGAGFEAVGGGGGAEAVRWDAEDNDKRMINIGQPISTMTISLNASTLVIGTLAGFIHLYDIASHQLLRSISTHKGLVITHLVTMLKPPDLVGHISLNLNSGSAVSAKDIMPTRPVAPFQRVRDAKTRDAHEVLMMLPASTNSPKAPWTYTAEDLQRDHAFFVGPVTEKSTFAGGSGSVSQQSHISELEAEVQKLREQLGRAKNINDVMWDTVVQRVVAEKKAEAAAAITSADFASADTMIGGSVPSAPAAEDMEIDHFIAKDQGSGSKVKTQKPQKHR